MATQTTNYGLHKIDLTDAPPDITVLNQNFDIIDTELKELSESTGDLTPEDIGAAPNNHTHTAEQVGARPATWTPTAVEVGAVSKAGDVMTGSLTVMDNFNVNKTYSDVEYKTFVRPINYSIGNNGNFATGMIHYNNGVNDSQLMFNKDGVMLRDNVNGKAYQIFGQHNADLLKTSFLPLDGGILTGNLDFKKVANGSGTIYKNHSATADFGMVFRDVDVDGNYNQLLMCAKENTLKYRDTSGAVNNVVTSNVKMTLSVNANGGLRITY